VFTFLPSLSKMASYLPTLRTTLPRASRSFASTSRALAQPPAESIQPSKSESVTGSETAGDVAQSGASPEGSSTTPVTSTGGGRGYNAWLSGEGARFRKGVKGRTNWIGDSVSTFSYYSNNFISSYLRSKSSVMGIDEKSRDWIFLKRRTENLLLVTGHC